MNRRGFFGLLGATAATTIVAPNLELLMPRRTIFLPPSGGWLPYQFNIIKPGNRLLTIQELAFEMREIMRNAIVQAHENMDFAAKLDREYERSFSKWPS